MKKRILRLVECCLTGCQRAAFHRGQVFMLRFMAVCFVTVHSVHHVAVNGEAVNSNPVLTHAVFTGLSSVDRLWQNQYND